MTEYVALLHTNSDNGYGVSFPDFPGCVSAFGTVDDALKEAADALAFHVMGISQDRERIPKPRTLEAIRHDNQDWVDDNVARIHSFR